MIFSISVLITIALFLIYTGIGFCIAIVKNQKGSFFEFQNTFMGSLIVIGFYALLKSNLNLNSVTISFLPLLLFSVLLKSNNTEVTLKRNLLYFAISLVILSVVNYFIYFRNGFVYTGYKDHSFYHIVASNINLFGKEYVQNVHNLNPISGGIYHYWDLWHLSFVYDIGLLFGLNCFESYVLVHKILLAAIVGYGAVCVLRIYKPHLIIYCIIIFLMALNIAGEFNILIHSKNYINFSLILLVILKLMESVRLEVPFFLFVTLVALFYNPLPGIPIIAALGLMVFWNRWRKLLIAAAGVVIILILYLLLFYKVYSPPIATNDINNLEFNIFGFLRHLFIYNGYHFFISNWWVILSILFFIFNKQIDIKLVWFFAMVILFGFVFSSLFYKHFEQFQFTNNLGFIISVILTMGVINAQNSRVKYLTLVFLLLISVWRFHESNKVTFYQGIILSGDAYNNMRQNRSSSINRKIMPLKFDGYKYNDSDFLFSILNGVPCYPRK
jgi:hypothetical protein